MSRQKYNEFIDLMIKKNGIPQYDFEHKSMNRIEGFCIHHRRPTALGGSNDSSNLVYLTPDEHLHAHKLLAEFAGPKMVLAYRLMSEQNPEAMKDYFNDPEIRKHRSLKAKQQHERMTNSEKIQRGNNISDGYKLWSKERRETENTAISKRKKRPVVGVCIQTGNMIEFDSGKETSKMGFSPSKVSECCNKRRDSYMGYVWSFKEQ